MRVMALVCGVIGCTERAPPPAMPLPPPVELLPADAPWKIESNWHADNKHYGMHSSLTSEGEYTSFMKNDDGTVGSQTHKTMSAEQLATARAVVRDAHPERWAQLSWKPERPKPDGDRGPEHRMHGGTGLCFSVPPAPDRCFGLADDKSRELPLEVTAAQKRILKVFEGD